MLWEGALCPVGVNAAISVGLPQDQRYYRPRRQPPSSWNLQLSFTNSTVLNSESCLRFLLSASSDFFSLFISFSGLSSLFFYHVSLYVAPTFFLYKLPSWGAGKGHDMNLLDSIPFPTDNSILIYFTSYWKMPSKICQKRSTRQWHQYSFWQSKKWNGIAWMLMPWMIKTSMHCLNTKSLSVDDKAIISVQFCDVCICSLRKLLWYKGLGAFCSCWLVPYSGINYIDDSLEMIFTQYFPIDKLVIGPQVGVDQPSVDKFRNSHICICLPALLLGRYIFI